MSRPNTPTYKTKNWPAYNEALKRRGALTIWFDPEMTWEAEPTGKRGRQPVYSDPAIQTCLTMKVLFGLALRQTTGFVESLLRLIGLKWTVPDFSTLSRRQKTLAVTIPHRGAQGPLHLLIDSTGIKVEGEGEWNARKHGGAQPHSCGERVGSAAERAPGREDDGGGGCQIAQRGGDKAVRFYAVLSGAGHRRPLHSVGSDVFGLESESAWIRGALY